MRVSVLSSAGSVAFGALLLGACADPTTELHVPAPDAQSFEQTVYPILLRDCGFPSECHGNPQRFFHIYGPGRKRARDTTRINDPVTGEELTLTYRRARSMLSYEGSDITDSLLLSKPLTGGHEGHDEWGNNVYRSANDASYKTLLAWARSMLPVVAMPDAGIVAMPDAGIVAMPDAGVVVMPDAGIVVMPDAGIVAMPDAALAAVPDAGVP